MNYTNGPWSGNYIGSYGYIIRSGGIQIATVLPKQDFCTTEQAKGNARLIAAAPEMYEAAKHAVMEWRLHGQLTDSCRVLEAALAKADGGK